MGLGCVDADRVPGDGAAGRFDAASALGDGAVVASGRVVEVAAISFPFTKTTVVRTGGAVFLWAADGVAAPWRQLAGGITITLGEGGSLGGPCVITALWNGVADAEHCVDVITEGGRVGHAAGAASCAWSAVLRAIGA